ncbi:hypothetical protein [Sandaracinus amylolyticus]|uniref:hypothetical protein n=1 Tax=Sandaracinus amylolyticus TaxID=927083 RepID=UPI001F1B4927|nr:hypothetical protein [Sandaracinus amylolyticus]UJR82730.1 Hypothetical protein I5071_47950 [Sandaracinus amylolyticus]
MSVARYGILVASVLLIAGCTASGSDVTPEADAGFPIIDEGGCPPVLCTGFGYVCREGRVHERVPVPAACDAPPTECPDGIVAYVCTLGCVEGSTDPGDPFALCAESTLPRVGTPCASDDDCTPSAPHMELRCDTALGTCTQQQPEVCNRTDDDRDTLVDEGCTCEARVVATIEEPVSPVESTMTHDRIALLAMSGDRSTARVHVIDRDGNTVYEVDDIPFAARVQRVGDELVVLQHDPSTGRTSLLRLREDGAHQTVVLDRTPIGGSPFVLGDERGWTLLLHVNGRIGLTRHSLRGERTAVRVATEMRTLLLASSDGAGGVVAYADENELPQIAWLDDRLALHPIASGGLSAGTLDAAYREGEHVVLATDPRATPRIFRIGTTGTLVEERTIVPPRRPVELTRLALEPATGATAIAFTTGGELTVARYDEAGEPVDVPVLTDAQPYLAQAFGYVGGALRLVTAEQDGSGIARWRVIDPCVPLP